MSENKSHYYSNGNKIGTEIVEKEWGEQIKFAVPEDGLNNPISDKIDEIQDEINSILDYTRELNDRFGYSGNQIVDFIQDTIGNIFSKYR